MPNKRTEILTQGPLPGFEVSVQTWERIVLELPNGHTKIISRKIG